ncbi:hypothetical protein Rsub_11348 [Raphidocelis subcapitata]|uniref:Uncharacterized protein n=1 Tax=Raphidocelis subcapitata TaxID=307507 RepID=A0A2V0PFN6_9CHLO|nr:hypothetical protein Rsub_11348 [Raphidocelis subcapitata]|eukprot:GBF97822.1 hypothetical protein Rsub_11348 [Raphidocelis subcapitata]
MLTRGSLSAQRGGGEAKWRGGATPLLASRRQRPLAAAPPRRRPQPQPLPPRCGEAEAEAKADALGGSLEAASATLSSGSLSSFQAEKQQQQFRKPFMELSTSSWGVPCEG